MRRRLFIVFALTLMLATLSACLSPRELNRNLNAIAKPYLFHTLPWEIKTIMGSTRQEIANPKVEDEENRVIDHFETVGRIIRLKAKIAAIENGKQTGDVAALNDELAKSQAQIKASERTVEDILERQMRTTLTELGVFNPFESVVKLRFNFPPMDFKIEAMPHLLVISPRNKIESLRTISLRQDLDTDDMAKVESAVDELGVSSLVVNLGGFSGTYPAMVTNEASLRFTLDAAAEEWLHQYLAFKPLGFCYLLSLTGLRRDYEIATMNETVASMLSKEIGGIVVQKYYPDILNEEAEEDSTGSEFDCEMRELRKTVDSLLLDGKIEEAEKLMADKRMEFAASGYYIRKLNQSYFAFYGTYADRPDSVSPIGVEMKQLRASSASLKDFLEKVAVMKSHQDLIESLK